MDFHLRTWLISLPKTIVTLNSDIALFNSMVQEISRELAARGQASTDMLVYLFLAYLEAEDKDFVDFIKHLKMRYDDGMEMLTAPSLMDHALNRYRQSVQAGTWKAKTPEQEQLIMLMAQLKDANAKISDLQSKPSMSSGSGANGGTRGRYPPWRYTRQGSETTKVVNGKTYYWCTGHPKPMWVVHKPTECKGKKNQSSVENREPSGSSTSLQVSRALAAIAKGIENNASDEESK